VREELQIAQDLDERQARHRAPPSQFTTGEQALLLSLSARDGRA